MHNSTVANGSLDQLVSVHVVFVTEFSIHLSPQGREEVHGIKKNGNFGISRLCT